MNNPAPFIHNRDSVARVMLTVVVAMLPSWLLWCWFFGINVVVQTLIIVAASYGSEYLMLRLRRRAVVQHIKDGSILITALALLFCLPPDAPWWIGVTGALFATIIGKHCYGGLGYNPFNPAMLGYAALLISFPQELSLWPPVATEFLHLSASLFTDHDAISAATPLDVLRNHDGGLEELQDQPWLASLGSSPWHWMNGLFLISGLALIATGVAAWQVPTGMLLSLLATASLLTLYDPTQYPPPWVHLFHGATMIGAFFVATDPVSCASSPLGRFIFGLLAGFLVFAIRAWGGYPDAIAFAILLANLSAPLIDYVTRPRVYGT